MDFKNSKVINKPEKWPANAIECQLDNISEQVDRFKKDPSYKNKEVLVSLVTDFDLNQRSMLGLFRTTDYEVACINALFVEANFLQLYALKTYLYELIGYKTRMQKMISWNPEMNVTLEINSFEGLFSSLELYYLSYQKFMVEKNKNYAKQLIEVIEDMIQYSKENDSEELFQKMVNYLSNAYIMLLNDISYFRCVKRTKIWAFSRDEIYSLIKLAAKLVQMTGESPVVSPLKGVLMMTLSNYIDGFTI